jgi:plastocyanin
MSNKYKIIIIVAGAIIIVVGFVCYNFRSQFYGTSQEFTVTLGENGFEPETLIISKGDTVIFRTTRDKTFWPASDLHPTHGIYSEFDPREPIDSRESWSFRFTKKGTWKYHDHLFSAYRGIIVVETEAKKAMSYSMADCNGLENKTKCWEDIIEETLDKKGLNSAFELLADLYGSYPKFASDCHSFAHKIGIAAYEKFAKSQDIELTSKTYYCGYGFYHGFMETLLQREGKADKAQEFCAYAGRKLSDQTSDAEGACYHGIGHGAVDGGDPGSWGDPQKMIAPGLNICEQVSKNKDHLYRCANGAFNAIEILSMDPKYSLKMIIEDPFWLCPLQPNIYKDGCYTNMIPSLLRLTNYDFEKSARIVEKIPATGDNEAIELVEHTVRGMVTLSLFYEYIGRNLKEPNYNANKGVAICRSLLPDLRLPCVEGLAGGHMKLGKPEQEYIQGLSFCGSEILKNDERDVCYKYVLVRLGIWYSSDKARNICQEVPEKYREFCAIK